MHISFKNHSSSISDDPLLVKGPRKNTKHNTKKTHLKYTLIIWFTSFCLTNSQCARRGRKLNVTMRSSTVISQPPPHTHRADSAVTMKWFRLRHPPTFPHLLHTFTLMGVPPTAAQASALCQIKCKQSCSLLLDIKHAPHLNLSTSASSTRKSLFCTSLWIFRISSSSCCLCFLVFSLSGGGGKQRQNHK